MSDGDELGDFDPDEYPGGKKHAEAVEEFRDMVEATTEGAATGGDTAVTAEADVTRRETGVRLRTNVQAGSASARVNVTLETHAVDMGDLVSQLDAYRGVLSDQVAWARREAKKGDGA